MTDKKKRSGQPKEDRAANNGTAVNEQDRVVCELTEALQRERADAINMRRHYESALAGVRRLSIVGVVRELLPAIDNLERSLKHIPQDLKDHDYVRGVQAVLKQFDKIFADLGIERIDTIGQPFDPRVHEAVHLDDSNSGSREIVSEELQPGYKLGDEVIRHAMVNVRLED